MIDTRVDDDVCSSRAARPGKNSPFRATGRGAGRNFARRDRDVRFGADRVYKRAFVVGASAPLAGAECGRGYNRLQSLCRRLFAMAKVLARAKCNAIHPSCVYIEQAILSSKGMIMVGLIRGVNYDPPPVSLLYPRYYEGSLALNFTTKRKRSY